MKGRGTADGMYVLRQMVEKRLEVHGSMALGFVDLEKAFDLAPREMVMPTLRWMGVPEAEVRMVEGKYEKTTARVVVGEGASDEFEVKIVRSSTGPHQQEDGDEGCHEETPLCRRRDLGGEWQTGAIWDIGGVERAVYQTRADN